MLPAGEYSAEQNRSVDRRYLRIPNPFTCYNVGPVEEESAMRRHLFPQETKRSDNTCPRVRKGYPSSVLCNAKRRETEPCRRDARHDATIGPTGIATILDKAGLRMGLFPEEEVIC